MNQYYSLIVIALVCCGFSVQANEFYLYPMVSGARTDKIGDGVPYEIYMSNFNGDHLPDLAYGWISDHPHGGTYTQMSIYLENQNNVFYQVDSRRKFHAPPEAFIIVRDWNQDGKDEIINNVPDDTWNMIYFEKGMINRQNIMVSGSIYDQIFIPICVGDFNGDQYLDIMGRWDNIFLLYGNGKGGFEILE